MQDGTIQTREDIFDTLRSALVELFELEPELLKLIQTKLF